MSDLFHLRFNIDVPVEAAQRRFINRIENRVRTLATELHNAAKIKALNVLDPLIMEVENTLGTPHDTSVWDTDAFVAVWREQVNGNFLRCLQAIEGLAKGVAELFPGEIGLRKVNAVVTQTLDQSEVDLGVSWQDGFFSRKGAQLLDEKIVNEPLRWLADQKYQNVLVPFRKGLSHLLEGTTDSHRLADSVTDMYEALEAMAKIVTGKPSKDLSALREELVAMLHLPAPYKTMLKEYIDYGCDFRHAVETGQQRTWPLEHEAETFVYLTGLFIRLAIQSEKAES